MGGFAREEKKEEHQDHQEAFVFDSSLLSHESNIPLQFVWPQEETPCPNAEDLSVPLIDLQGFLSGDPDATFAASRLISEACTKHGFFQVVNHGVDHGLIDEAHRLIDTFFTMPLLEKQRAQRKPGESCGYASSFTGRFSSKLPWKETLSFGYCSSPDNSNMVEEYLVKLLGEGFRDFGVVNQEYCEAMSTLSLGIMELLGISLGVGRKHFRDFFKGNDSIMRLNYYPPCQKPDLTLGTGPHCDPTSLTILHQDQVGGLQVFVEDKWHNIAPKPDAFVVNIGDTFMVIIGKDGNFFTVLKY
eukprot:TRINITY_DN2983_c0_g1_i1.p1 TRINITY_DN2983_c0_g1~~TRINITY_DN2983_c0_g1_i1.p1  ORF type:complete len:332 (+),score=34.04 TRINITY_DN2983_c0_g1_i1:95-997(+)